MKKTIFRLYYVWQWENEEKWLNEMSSEGWQLAHATIGKYNFVSGKVSEYTYRLELLDKKLKSEESTSYLNFLKETGIEMVGKCKSWIYLRSKTTDGGFEPNNKTLYNLTHLLKVQELTNKIRNILITMIAMAICTLLIMEFFGESHVTNFLRGFCTGLCFSSSIFSVVMIPFIQKSNEKIKKTIKELYTCE
ncbi:MAG: DUF2812 domain-containing protein [Bacteroidia bacterium]|nr:DUF2812 domain-containing protein [Bacteroidia bacterium]